MTMYQIFKQAQDKVQLEITSLTRLVNSIHLGPKEKAIHQKKLDKKKNILINITKEINQCKQ